MFICSYFLDNNAPVISIDKPTAVDGDSVTLTCAANTNPTPNAFKFYKGSGTEIASVTSSTHQITVTSNDNEEKYYCKTTVTDVNSGADSAKSNELILSVKCK